jgi:hypothetical protein
VQLTIPASWTDPKDTETLVDFRSAPFSRRELLVSMSAFAGAALPVGSWLDPKEILPRSVSTFWSDGTDWVE